MVITFPQPPAQVPVGAVALPEWELQGKSVNRRFVLKGVAQLLVSLLFFLFLAEMAARYLVVSNPNREASHAIQAFFTKLTLADRLAVKEPTIVLLGDSHMDFAGVPELLQARLRHASLSANDLSASGASHSMMPLSRSGKQRSLASDARHYQVVNLASPSVTLDLSLRVLERARRSGAVIQLVVLNINTRHFNRLALSDPDATIEGNLTHTYEGRCLFASPTSLSGKLGCFFQKYFYLLRYRTDLKAQLNRFDEVLLKPDSLLLGSKPDIYPAREVSPMGWAPGYPLFNPKEVSKRHAQPGSARAMLWDEAAMNRFLAYCRQSHIQPVLTVLPVHPRYRARMPMDPDIFRQRVAEYATRQGVPFWDFLDLFQSPALAANAAELDLNFTDYDHVSAQGALKTTDRLAERVVRLLKMEPFERGIQKP
jgi:hypothetical protein